MRGGRVSSPNTRGTGPLGGLWGLFLEIKASAYLGLKTYFRYPAWFVADIVTTPIWILVFILPVLLFLPREMWRDPGVINFFYWAMVMWDIVSAGLWSFGMAIRREQETGTLEFLFLTNANRAVMFTRGIFTRIMTLSISVTYMTAIFMLLFGTPISFANPLGIVAALFLGLLVSCGFGELYGALVFRFKNVGPVTNIVQFIILGISGIFFPVTSIPEPYRGISYISPFTFIADLVRHEAMGMPTLLPVWGEWLILSVLAVTLNLVGLGTILWIEKTLKVRGELGAY